MEFNNGLFEPNKLKNVELIYICDKCKDCKESISCSDDRCYQTRDRLSSKNWKHREPTFQEIFNLFEYLDENDDTILYQEKR